MVMKNVNAWKLAYVNPAEAVHVIGYKKEVYNSKLSWTMIQSLLESCLIPRFHFEYILVIPVYQNPITASYIFIVNTLKL